MEGTHRWSAGATVHVGWQAGGDGQSGAEASSERIVVERPPPGLARGRYDWPAWAIGSVGTVAFVLGLVYVVWRFRRLRRS